MNHSVTIQVIWTVAFFILAYLVGSINFSILLFKILGRGDPREKFSGNPGATNVKRQLGSGWAALVLILDLGRSAGAGLIAQWLFPHQWWPLLGLGLILGNRYPLFHGFRGGKGVAAYLGFTAAITPLWAGIACLAWLAAFLVARQPFIGSFFMIGLLGVGTIYHLGWAWPVLSSTLPTIALIGYAHQSNVSRYRAGRMS